MQGGFSLPLLVLAGLYTLVVLGRVRGLTANLGQPSMTADDGSSSPTTVRARAESEERVSFVLHVQTSNTLPASLSFVLYPPPTSFPTLTLTPLNSTSSLEHTVTSAALNSTTSSTSPRPTTKPEEKPKPEEKWTLNIESGNKGVHIGSWTPDVTYHGIRRGLRERCGDGFPPTKKARRKGKGKVVHKTWGMNTCDSKDSLYDREYATKLGLQRLEYELVQVKIASSYIPESYGLDMQNIFIEQIADMFRLAVLDDKNCHGFNTKATSCMLCIPHTCIAQVGPEKGQSLDEKALVRRWCNVPDYVRVGLAGPDGKEVAHMRVEVRIICLKRSEGCIMEMGKFDCMAVVGATGGEARVNGTRGAMLKKAAQGNDVDVVAVCPNKEITGKCPNKECVYKMGC